MTKLHYLPLSPPARYVHFFASVADIPLDVVFVNLLKGEHKSPEYLAINPHGQIPALQEDDGFVVFESAAIIRYLAAKHPNSVFPVGDAKAQATIDSHAELIKSKLSTFGSLVFNKVFAPKFGAPSDEAAAEKAKEEVNKGLTHLESTVFKTSPHYVVGSSISLADVYLGVILTQLELVQFDLSAFPKAKEFITHLKTLPAYSKTHDQFYEVLKTF
eukprot:TRINITY_DN11230_c0_g1_i1.p1 TRINITY_DN11230_c0_g1~~TRINITY_DN11230_c0_g1_i1.p1  ORF type:complete len:226 (-),score=110.56 TRINITY_DN11230_c0_g1_i1:109-756(-)